MKRLTALILLVAVAGCGEDEAAAPAPAPAPRKKAAAETVAAATTTQVDYVYNAFGKRDPFRSYIDVPIANGPTAPVPEQGCDEPLCKMDLDELKVVAVVSGDANPLAMLEDRAGVGHLVRRNTRVGKQQGKVIQILRDCIVVLSFVSGGADGKPKPNKQNLCVQSSAQAGPPIDLLQNKEYVP